MSTQAVLCSALERLNHFCEGDIALKELLDGVDQLNSDLRRVADTLSDADAEANRQVRELAYDIENSVECFVRRQEAEARSSSSKWSGYIRCLSKYYCSSERSFLEDLQEFSRRGKEVTSGSSSSSSNRDNPERQLIDRRQLIRETNYHESVSIGLEKYQTELTDRLKGGDLRLSVVAICGMGGIGKTTLARSAYNMKDRFHICAWVTVGQEYQVRDILEAILSTLGIDHTYKNEAMETMELTGRIYKALKGRKYLLCLDDVWSVDAWDSLRFLFPDDANGSRILITTRSMEVARYASRSIAPIEMDFLNDEQSWQLFKIKTGLQEDSDEAITKIAKQILISCRGLPLAISVMGQTLSRTSLQNWERMLRILHSVQEERVDVLELSYKHLPFHLKPCFLYMGHFPPHQPISVKKLNLLWMAEGLISKRKSEDKDYFKELVDRNLVLGVEKEESLPLGEFRSCQVHELIRNLCISRGKQEEFLEVIDFAGPNKLPSTYTCRLAVYLDKFEDTNDVSFNIPDAKRIRSILFFDTVDSVPKSTWPRELADLSNFQGIRVLDFDRVNFQGIRLPMGIEKLTYLRHLSFQGCFLQKFPSSFDKFYFLETLDLRVVDSCVMTIPNVLRKLTRLRHLYFPLAFQCDGNDKLKLDSLTSLVVVENFDAGSCEAGDLLQLENLQILKGTVDGNNSDLANIINSIKKMNSTCRSSLIVKRFDSYSKERLSIVADLLQLEAVHALELEGHLGAFPHGIVFGKWFTEMAFNGSEFSENPMPVLGQLPHLRSLVLCNDAVLESKLVCCESGFPELRSLKLATLQSLKELEVENEAMPMLTILTIEQCHKLEMLPSELFDLISLDKLMIGSMPQDFQRKVNESSQEAEENGFNIQVKFYDC